MATATMCSSSPRRCAAALGVCAVVATSLIAGATPMASAAPPVPSDATSAYSPISPVRVLDTRTGGALLAHSDIVVDPLTPQVLAAAAVERGMVVAVVVNAALTEVVQPGFLTLYPSDTPREEVSNLNMERSGQTLANVSTVPVGADGLIRAFNSTGGHLVLDVQGVYVAAQTASAGRLVMFTSPQRAWDSRTNHEALSADQTRLLSLAGAGVPSSASAALLNVTVTAAVGAGFTTVWPANEARPTASNVNVDRVGQTAANQVIAKVSSSSIMIYSMAGSDVIVDVAGYYTGASAQATTNGLFVPFAPRRLLDTRLPSGTKPVAAGSTLWVDTKIAAGDVIPAGASAVAANLTITEAAGPGFVTAFPTLTARPATSSINADHVGQTVANHAVIRTGSTYFNLYTSNATHMIVDASGYFTAAIPAPVPGDPATDPLPPGGPPNLTLDYNFLYAEDAEGYPAYTMDPCKREVTYRIDAGGSSPAQRALVDGVVARVEAASGFDLVYLGPLASGINDTDIKLSFRSNESMSGSAVSATHYRFSFPGLPGGEAKYIGTAIISVNDSYTDPTYMTEFLLWVFAAALGLGKADGSDQIMSTPFMPPWLGGYATGDREGLRLLGYRNCG